MILFLSSLLIAARFWVPINKFIGKILYLFLCEIPSTLRVSSVKFMIKLIFYTIQRGFLIIIIKITSTLKQNSQPILTYQ